MTANKGQKAVLSLEDLKKIGHFDIPNIQGRTIPSLMFYVSGNWEWWAHTEIGIMKLQGWPVESGYFGVEAALETDISFPFLDFIFQKCSYPKYVQYASGISDDIFNMSASLRKMSFLHEKREEIGHGLSRMIVGEIEYLISTCRGMFDLLQELIARIWQKINYVDPDAPSKKHLVDRFFKMVAKGEEATPLSAEEIAEKYNLPDQLAQFYVRQSDFFIALRDFRDRIIHSGKSVDTIFVADDDFLIREAFIPLSGLGWHEAGDRRENNLIVLTPTLNVIVFKTILALNDFSDTIQSFIQFPPPLVPGMRYYLRGYFDEHFKAAISEFEGRRQRMSASEAQ